jgi:very-short-patch-repair endonuclease
MKAARRSQTDKRVPRARTLRQEMTAAERKLWQQLKLLSINGSHFHRQATTGPYFADFACHRQRLVIEVDGGQHGTAAGIAADTARSSYLKAQGYKVLRFWNSDVLRNIEGVMTAIVDEISARNLAEPPTPDPSPPRAGGGERRGTA